MRVVVILPAYNVEKTIRSVIRKAKKYSIVLVIDDGSTDNTRKVAKDEGVKVISHSKNRGLGAALRTGFKAALSYKPDIIITADSDGQHNLDDIPRFISTISNGYDFVLGERDLRKYPLTKKFGNFFLNMATNFISGTNLKDTESGFRAFRKSALKKLYLKARRYEIAVEIVFEVGRNNLKTKNIPIKSPIYVKGVGVVDGFKNFLFLLHRRERTWRSYIDDLRYVLRKRL